MEFYIYLDSIAFFGKQYTPEKLKPFFVKKAFLTCILMMAVVAAFTKDIFVSPTGEDVNNGSINAPYKTIQKAFANAVAGDIIYLRAGTYRETVALTNKSGAYNKPITLTAYNNEKAIISGLDVKALSWTSNSGTPNVWVAAYSGSEFEQLFFDGQPMLEARWPNVARDTNGEWNFWASDAWASVDANGNSYGTVKDADLAATWNITGARTVLNVAHQFYTWTRIVSSHIPGSGTFNYPNDLGASVSTTDNFNDDRYYLLGMKFFLDSPGEWYYDVAGKLLYFYPPSGVDPNTKVLEIKSRNFALTTDQNSKYLTIDGITFFGTAFSFGKDPGNRSKCITFQNNQVLYSSWTEYLIMPLGDAKVNNDKNFPMIQSDSVKFLNNTFAYGALNGLLVNGYANLIENNLFHDFCFSSSLVYPVLEVSRNWAYYVGKGGKAIVRNNTLYNCGGISIEIGQSENEVYLNDLYNAFRACWGGNRDQSALYTGSTYCSDTRLHHNWVHDSYAGTPPLDWGGGMAIRGDDNTTGLTVDHNVVWNIGSAGLELKNPDNPIPDQANRVMNNTIFQHSANNPVKSAMIVQTLANQNKYSLVVNNMAESIFGHWFGKELGPVADFSCNSTGKVIESYLESPSNFDFRPKLAAVDMLNKGKIISGITNSVFGSAPDIGAYERSDSIYWIPGQRSSKASFPIIPDLTINVPLNRDILMWRPAYKAVSHQVYFGTSKENLELKVKLAGEKNVFILPKLSAGMQYWWRADAIMADGTVAKGDIWSFTTESAITGIANTINDNPQNANVVIYPNPTRSTITIVGLNNNYWTLRNILGQELAAGSHEVIDISTYPIGVYLMSINNSTYKIIKK